MIIIKVTDIVDYLFEKYKENKDFSDFINETNLIDRIIQSLRRKTYKTDEVQKSPAKNPTPKKNETSTNLSISNSDGFSKLIFEDLKIKRALSEDKVAQEHLLSQNDIRECFSYLSKSYNNIKLYQGKTWVVEYSGGL